MKLTRKIWAFGGINTRAVTNRQLRLIRLGKSAIQTAKQLVQVVNSTASITCTSVLLMYGPE